MATKNNISTDASTEQIVHIIMGENLNVSNHEIRNSMILKGHINVPVADAIIADIYDETGIYIPKDKLFNFHDVGAIVQYIEQVQAKKE